LGLAELKKLTKNVMHNRAWHQHIEGMLVGVYTCIVLASLEGCQGCHRGAVAPNPSETGIIETVTPNLRVGIPNLGNTCYMNSVLQIIAKLYPSAFDGNNEPLAKAGQVIVKKIKNDQDYVTMEEADTFYTALLAASSSQFARGRQEDAQECMAMLFGFCKIVPPQYLCERITDPTGSNIYSAWREEYSLCDISIPRDNCTMQECLESDFADAALTGENQYDYNGTKVDAQRQYRLRIGDNQSQFPFSIFLKRFDQNLEKKHDHIRDPFQLTIPIALQYNGIEALKYTLIGFVHHVGDSVNSGHYVAYIQQNGQWKRYNDAWVEKVEPAQAEQAAESAYLYFYSKTS
jgi:ubiquitin C-terminal hydrolase